MVATMEGGAVLQCPTCDDEDAACPDCIRIEAAVRDLSFELGDGLVRGGGREL